MARRRTIDDQLVHRLHHGKSRIPVEEIAQAMHVTPSAVYASLRRTRQAPALAAVLRGLVAAAKGRDEAALDRAVHEAERVLASLRGAA